MKIGIVGGGQLARMLALAGIPMGLRFSFYDPSDDCCAAILGEHFKGTYDDKALLVEFAGSVDVVTYEFENVPIHSIESIAQKCKVYPGIKALEKTQDRLEEKKLFQSLGMNTAQFLTVDSLEDVKQAAHDLGFPFVLKSRSGGYDGKGQVVIRTKDDLQIAWENSGKTHLLAEAWVRFEREVSMIAVRCTRGETVFYDLVQNQHHQGILQKSFNCPGDPYAQQARDNVEKLLDALEYVGTFAVEFFQVGSELLANEYAPRVHNTGHWTIEGAKTSQFENHIRAIAGLPLGSTEHVGYSAMLNLVGEKLQRELPLQTSDVHFHDYDKAPRPGRKIGHITIRDEEKSKLEKKTEHVFQKIHWDL